MTAIVWRKMITKLHKYFIAVASMLCLLGMVSTSSASTSKHLLQQKVEKDVSRILLAEFEKNPKTAVDRPKIIADVQRIAQPIDTFKSAEVNDEVAGWIEQSFAALVQKRASVLITQSPSSLRLVQQLSQQAKKRFSEMSNEDGTALLQKRKTLLAEAAVYRDALKKFLALKLNAVTQFKLDLGLYAMADIDGNSFVRIAQAINVTRSSPDNTKLFSALNMNDRKIASALLSWALLHEVREQMDKRRVADEFSFGNILSGCFDKDAVPLKLKTFSETAPEVEAAWNSAVKLQGRTAIIDYSSFQNFFYDSASFRWIKRQPEKTNPISIGNFLSFRNTPGIWELVQD